MNNGIPIRPFRRDKADNELSELLCFLKEYIVKADDVRIILKEYFQLERFIDY
jgi:hypothetical protein